MPAIQTEATTINSMTKLAVLNTSGSIRHWILWIDHELKIGMVS